MRFSWNIGGCPEKFLLMNIFCRFKSAFCPAVSCLFALVAPLQAANKPNIIFILCDDLGWRDLGIMGSTFYQTPNIDRLAADGMRFTDAYAANPLCSPTRAGVITGLFPQHTGFTSPGGHMAAEVFTYGMVDAQPWARGQNATSATRLDTNFTTYAELLQADGYSTAHFGKWHIGFPPFMPKDHGFDVDIPSWNVPGPGQGYIYPWNMPGQPELSGTPGEQLEERMGREIGDFIRAHKDRPFFVNYWAFTPHSPFSARPDLVEKYAVLVDKSNPQQSPTMAAMIESLDFSVGHILKVLYEEGLADNTIIVFTSDNGGNMYDLVDGVPPTNNAPLKSGKGTIYEGGIRVPLIVVWPGVTKPGSVSPALVETTDLFATFLEMAGIPLPKDYPGDGVSLVPVLKGEKPSLWNDFFCYFPQNVEGTGNLSAASFRRGNLKLIRFFADNPDGSDRLELYNLAEDIGETRNLAREQPTVAAELNDALETKLQTTNTLVPGKNKSFDPASPLPPAVEALHGPRNNPESPN
jgi:arylsulfatase A-like enzyme